MMSRAMTIGSWSLGFLGDRKIRVRQGAQNADAHALPHWAQSGDVGKADLAGTMVMSWKTVDPDQHGRDS